MRFRSYFKFSGNERSGILLLLCIVIALQCVYFFAGVTSDDVQIHPQELMKFQKEVDSVKLVLKQEDTPKLNLFNPNYITDYKGYTLGMSNEEIDRLLVFRSKNQWINSAVQFQEVTKISDSLLNAISPYFKFPDWVTNPKPQSNFENYSSSYTSKTYAQKTDLNKATAQQLQKITGVGEKLSERIIQFRSKFNGGFIADIQLQDIYGLSPEVIERITNEFTVKTPRQIQKINLNTATREQLVTIQHIDYEAAHYILEQRTLRERFESLDDLTKVKGFPSNKIEIIKLYLTLD